MVPSIWHILIVVLIVFVLFGKGRVSGVMEDLAKGIKAFKSGLKDEDGGSAKSGAPGVLENKEADGGKE